MQEGRGWRAIAIVGATIGLMLVVAFASRPVQLASGGASHGSVTHVLGDVGLYLLMVLLAVMLGLVIWALWPERLRRTAPRRRPWWELLIPYVALALMMGLFAFLLRNPRALHRLQQSSLGRLFGGLQGRPPAGGRVSNVSTTPSGPDWTAIIIVAVIVAAVIALLVWRWQAARRRLPTPQELALDLEEVLDSELTRLDPEADDSLDAREAVIAAWVGFERVLGGAGMPVRPGEAPHEYLTRALGELSLPLDVTALRSFTDLFEWARYSSHPVTDAMRQRAVATLRAVRDSVHHQAVPDLHVVPA